MRLKAGLSTAALAAVLLFTALLRAPFLNMPLERDEGGYAYGAQVIERGGAPYRDTFEHKGPALFFAYELAFHLFGESPFSVHLLFLLWVLASQCLLFAVALRLADLETACGSCLAYALLSFDPALGLGTAALTELAMAAPILLGALATLVGVESGGAAWFFCAGAALGLAGMIKQTAIFEALFFLGFGLWKRHRAGETASGLFRSATAYAVGCALAPAVFCLFFRARGAFHDFFYYAFLYNFSYAAPQTGNTGLHFLWHWVLPDLARSNALLWLFAALGLGALWRDGRALFPAGWLAASFLGLLPGLLFFPHYFQQLYPPLALAAGFGLRRASLALTAKVPRAAAAAVVALAACALPAAAHAREWFSLSPEAVARENYPGQPFAEAPRIADYLRRNTQDGDTVFIFGSEPEILFYSGRKSATRFDFLYPLVEGTPESERRQREAMAEILAAAPKYIVVVDIEGSTLEPRRAGDYLSRALAALVRRAYERDGLVEPRRDESLFYLGKQELVGAPPPGNEAIYLYRRKAAPFVLGKTGPVLVK